MGLCRTRRSGIRIPGTSFRARRLHCLALGNTARKPTRTPEARASQNLSAKIHAERRTERVAEKPELPTWEIAKFIADRLPGGKDRPPQDDDEGSEQSKDPRDYQDPRDQKRR